ncbi:MAG: sulfotransferase family 2 domain-containing protein [Cyanobacteria bacterium J06635_15]
MIICHKYKFIFLKTRKTAGTSIEIGLSHHCERKDVLAPLVPKDEKIRHAHTGLGKQNYIPSIRNYHFYAWLKLLKTRSRIQYVNHTTAQDVRATIPQSVWNNYFKFCFERNPWDKAVSWYYWKTAGLSEPPSLCNFLQREDSNKISNFGIYSILGEIAVDYIARFEDLDYELEKVSKILGLPSALNIPKTKYNNRPKNLNYKQILSKESQSMIEEICHREIGLLNYQY